MAILASATQRLGGGPVDRFHSDCECPFTADAICFRSQKTRGTAGIERPAKEHLACLALFLLSAPAGMYVTTCQGPDSPPFFCRLRCAAAQAVRLLARHRTCFAAPHAGAPPTRELGPRTDASLGMLHLRAAMGSPARPLIGLAAARLWVFTGDSQALWLARRRLEDGSLAQRQPHMKAGSRWAAMQQRRRSSTQHASDARPRRKKGPLQGEDIISGRPEREKCPVDPPPHTLPGTIYLGAWTYLCACFNEDAGRRSGRRR